MLTTNSIKDSDKHYSLLKKCFNQFKEQLYKDTGLELVQTSNAFKLQLADEDQHKTTFSSNFEYGMYFLILVALISEAKNAIIPMETLATQVLAASPDIDQNRDLIFKKVIKKVELDRIISIENEYDSNGNKYQVVVKKNNPSIYFGETAQKPLSNVTKIIQYLLTHQSMNKLEDKNLWKNVSITDVRRQLEPYSNDEAGYEVYVNGDIVRLATTLLENNEKSLRLILRDQLKSVNEHVSENVDAFVANMNRSNPSHLQFSAKSSISDQGRNILNALKDRDLYNNFFDQLQERIHQQLQNPDITPDDIIEYMLAEIEPRRWYDLAMFYERDNNQEIKPLTTQAINSFSTGERVRCYYIPMFALLEIVQSQMNPDVPRILLMDEAFAPVDNDQTALLLEKIYDLCDLFIATTPGKTLPIVSNSTGSTTLQLQRININGRPVVQSFGGPIYEEIA